MATQKRFTNLKNTQPDNEFVECQWSLQSSQKEISDSNTLKLVFQISNDESSDDLSEELELPMYKDPLKGQHFVALTFAGGEFYVLAHKYVDGQKLNMSAIKVSASLFDKGASFPVGSFRGKHFETLDKTGKEQNKTDENIIASFINQAWKYSTNVEFWGLRAPSTRTATADLESGEEPVTYLPGAQSTAIGPVSCFFLLSRYMLKLPFKPVLYADVRYLAKKVSLANDTFFASGTCVRAVPEGICIIS